VAAQPAVRLRCMLAETSRSESTADTSG
jgi:hypothetical protein